MKYLFIALFSIVFLVGCGTNTKNDDKDEANKKRDLLIGKIRNEYKILSENDARNFKYTIQFTSAFIDSSYLYVTEPFLGIDDFLIKNNKSYIRFSSWSPTIYFNIECDTNNFTNLLNTFKQSEYKEVLLVIKINDIKKIFLTADPQNDGEDNTIELDYSSSFMANGQLITYRFIN